MSLKQTSFNFDFSDEPSKPIEKVVVATEEIVVDKEPIEVDLIPVSSQSNSNDVVIKKSTRGRMKLSDMAAEVDKVVIPDDEELFSKRYYSIGAVTEMFKVNHSLLRFWENEFDMIKPKKNGKGDRLFKADDVKNVQVIYHLLREKKYTIEGAKDYLRNNKKSTEKFEVINQLQQLKQFLLQITADLQKV
jgi:DNA-binding transcriptional MerR regulator